MEKKEKTLLEKEQELKKLLECQDQLVISIEYAGTSLTIPVPSEKVREALNFIGIVNRTLINIKGIKVCVDAQKGEEKKRCKP